MRPTDWLILGSGTNGVFPIWFRIEGMEIPGRYWSEEIICFALLDRLNVGEISQKNRCGK
jgi:hypothetical protein